jgi:DNA-binding NtrC family response regulator
MKATTTILIVDDNPNQREMLHAVLSEWYQVVQAANAQEAYEQLAGGEIDLALLDLHLNGLAQDRTGFEILKSIRRDESRRIGVIMLTIENAVATAVEAMQLGADHYLSKNCSDVELLIMVDRVLEIVQMRRAQFIADHQSENEIDPIVGQHPALVKVLEDVDKAANFDSPVLILGESGTGKELIAQRLHHHSWRKQQKLPFIAINCAALPNELLESELFGHEKGAFTGAHKRQIGKFEIADRGTIFLDEIDSMPLPLQSKLLRVLSAKIFEPLGENRKVRLRARLVAASKSDLQTAMAGGNFRDDLYFRLSGVLFTLPPLRERADDIPLLVSHFLQKLNRQYGRHIERVDEDAMKCLRSFRWPGNVRELNHVIESAFIRAEVGTRCITADMLLEYLCEPEARSFKNFLEADLESLNFHQATALLKQQMIKMALKRSKGNISQAAQSLGITRRGLQKMLKLI